MAITHGGNIFAVARQHGWDWRDMLDFSASINPLGPAPGVRQAIISGIDRIGHYPEREPLRLASALADIWNVHPDQILLGNGATELIFFLVRTLKSAGVTLALPVFSEFHRAFPQAHFADLRNPATWSVKDLLVLTRPANPTGWTLPLDTLQTWLKTAKNPVLIDESFLEFSGHLSASILLNEYPQLLILRSLTKFYALPGLRIGALVGDPQTVRQWRLEREPWQVNVLAQDAALAALADEEHGRKSLEFVRAERHWLREQLKSLSGIEPAESDANFLYLHAFPSAQKIVKHLLGNKILVRDCTGWPGLPDGGLRIAVRTRPENERLMAAWRSFSCE
jgi:threonine-phosphate decarboxylase